MPFLEDVKSHVLHRGVLVQARIPLTQGGEQLDGVVIIDTYTTTRIFFSTTDWEYTGGESVHLLKHCSVACIDVSRSRSVHDQLRLMQSRCRFKWPRTLTFSKDFWEHACA